MRNFKHINNQLAWYTVKLWIPWEVEGLDHVECDTHCAIEKCYRQEEHGCTQHTQALRHFSGIWQPTPTSAVDHTSNQANADNKPLHNCEKKLTANNLQPTNWTMTGKTQTSKRSGLPSKRSAKNMCRGLKTCLGRTWKCMRKTWVLFTEIYKLFPSFIKSCFSEAW